MRAWLAWGRRGGMGARKGSCPPRRCWRPLTIVTTRHVGIHHVADLTEAVLEVLPRRLPRQVADVAALANAHDPWIATHGTPLIICSHLRHAADPRSTLIASLLPRERLPLACPRNLPACIEHCTTSTPL